MIYLRYQLACFLCIYLFSQRCCCIFKYELRSQRTMVSLMTFTITTIFLLVVVTEANVTNVSRKNVLLSRRKRYLTFPEGTNFVITLSLTKPLLQVQPTGWNMLLECDVPFIIPSDTRLFKKTKRHIIERKNIFNQLEIALTETGWNGSACVKRLLCEALSYKNLKGKSLVKDLLYATFAYPEDDPNFSKNMQENECQWITEGCQLPLLDYIAGSMGYDGVST